MKDLQEEGRVTGGGGEEQGSVEGRYGEGGGGRRKRGRLGGEDI